MDEDKQTKMSSARTRDLGCLLFMVLVGGYLWIAYVPSFMASRGQGRLTECKSNLKTIAAQCDKIFEETESLPKTLKELKQIPNCPEANEDTYSAGYSVLDQKTFEILCNGHHHEWARQPENFPRYHSSEGFIDPPRDESRP